MFVVSVKTYGSNIVPPKQYNMADAQYKIPSQITKLEQA